MKRKFHFLIVIFLTFLGCDASQKKEDVSSPTTDSAPTAVGEIVYVESTTEGALQPKDDSSMTTSSEARNFNPFYIFSDKSSRQNHYVPSGFMPNGKCLHFEDGWTDSCRSGSSCIRIEYDLECSRKGDQWAGIYWLNPANNWGTRKGGYNLTGAEKLTFWARGDKGGEQIQEFTVGGISGDFEDSGVAVLGPVILSPEWRQYTVDLRGKNLSYVSGGFAWTTNQHVNGQSCVFYLDDIRYE